jgi:hypothetical protein
MVISGYQGSVGGGIAGGWQDGPGIIELDSQGIGRFAMNISEVARSGRPFAHNDMIGAFMYLEDKLMLVHHDNVSNYRDMSWVRTNAVNSVPMQWLSPYDLVRDD